MKKSKKVLIIVALALFGALVTAAIPLYILFPVEFKDFVNNAWNWLNEPLPVVGISVLMLIVFAWNIFKSTSFGKKQINLFKERTEVVETALDNSVVEYEKLKEFYEKRFAELQNEVDFYKLKLNKVCDAIPNKKVKLIGAEKYGEETTNDQTETN